MSSVSVTVLPKFFDNPKLNDCCLELVATPEAGPDRSFLDHSRLRILNAGFFTVLTLRELFDHKIVCLRTTVNSSALKLT
jgi:hypothetical protein